MLDAAGLSYVARPADIDEDGLTRALRQSSLASGPDDVARMLAREKARAVAALEPGAVVIGSDQVLALGDDLLTKPGSIEGVRETMFRLRGRTHTLHAGVAVMGPGDREPWIFVDRARLRMCALSDRFIEDYATRFGEEVKGSVGAYHIEGYGVQLFDEVDGDQFTIRGMPLIPLLGELRRRGVLPE
jgi:septum formation protein